MRRLKQICRSLFALSVLALLYPQTVSAADEPVYTYTVRLYAGNQGTLTEAGITAPGGTVEYVSGADGKVEMAVIRGIEYGQEIYINAQEAARTLDDRYSVKGVRRSGRDNTEAVSGTGAVGSDMDYVIAYGVNGDTASYVINYLDTDGNVLLTADSYYGNIGERQYVSARYVEGYQPQAYNLVKTIEANEAENVFDFIYTPVGEADAGTEGTGEGTDEAGAAGGTAGGDDGTAGADDGTAGADGEEAEGADAGAQDTVGGDMTAVQDEETPLALQDLDGGEKDTIIHPAGFRLGYFPFYIMIAAVAVLALVISAVYLEKRRRKSMGEYMDYLSDKKM